MASHTADTAQPRFRQQAPGASFSLTGGTEGLDLPHLRSGLGVCRTPATSADARQWIVFQFLQQTATAQWRMQHHAWDLQRHPPDQGGLVPLR